MLGAGAPARRLLLRARDVVGKAREKAAPIVRGLSAAARCFHSSLRRGPFRRQWRQVLSSTARRAEERPGLTAPASSNRSRADSAPASSYASNPTKQQARGRWRGFAFGQRPADGDRIGAVAVARAKDALLRLPVVRPANACTCSSPSCRRGRRRDGGRDAGRSVRRSLTNGRFGHAEAGGDVSEAGRPCLSGRGTPRTGSAGCMRGARRSRPGRSQSRPAVTETTTWQSPRLSAGIFASSTRIDKRAAALAGDNASCRACGGSPSLTSDCRSPSPR